MVKTVFSHGHAEPHSTEHGGGRHLGILYYVVALWVMAGSWFGPIIAFGDSIFTYIILIAIYVIAWLILGRFCVYKALSMQGTPLSLCSAARELVLLVGIVTLSALALRFMPTFALILTFFTLPLAGIILLNALQSVWRKIALLMQWGWVIILIFGYAALLATPDGLGEFAGKELAYAMRALESERCYGLAYDNRIDGVAKQVISVDVIDEISAQVTVQTYTWMRSRAETVVFDFEGLRYTSCEVIR